jgi:hypothetical protein
MKTQPISNDRDPEGASMDRAVKSAVLFAVAENKAREAVRKRFEKKKPATTRRKSA